MDLNTTTNLALNKEDIILVLINEKESQFYSDLESAQKLLKEKKEEEEKIYTSMKTLIEEKILTNLKLKGVKVIIELKDFLNKSDKVKQKPLFIISELEKLSNPLLSIKRNSNTRTLTHTNMIFDDINFFVAIEIPFFEEIVKTAASRVYLSNSELKKIIDKELKELLKQYNLIQEEIFDLKIDINKIELNILLLNKDKSIKANLYKKLINKNQELVKLIEK